MPAATPSIKHHAQDHIFWIVFDNPARMNALTAAMWAELPKIISAAENDRDIRVIILKGEGDKAFSAGADISEFDAVRTGEDAKVYDELNHAAFLALENCSKPTIAMINGYCLGGGLELALCCDLRIASEKSIFSIPAAKLGIGYNARWIKPLLNAVSVSFAKEILFTGRSYNHKEAIAMGLINKVTPYEMIEESALNLASEIAENAPLSIRAAKRAINELSDFPENPDLKELDQLVEDCFASEDYEEGRRAFKEKRKPEFQGK